MVFVGYSLLTVLVTFALSQTALTKNIRINQNGPNYYLFPEKVK